MKTGIPSCPCFLRLSFFPHPPFESVGISYHGHSNACCSYGHGMICPANSFALTVGVATFSTVIIGNAVSIHIPEYLATAIIDEGDGEPGLALNSWLVDSEILTLAPWRKVWRSTHHSFEKYEARDWCRAVMTWQHNLYLQVAKKVRWRFALDVFSKSTLEQGSPVKP